MPNYDLIGREQIKQSTEHLLEQMTRFGIFPGVRLHMYFTGTESVDNPFTNYYGSCHFFEIALRRIGMDDVATKFTDPSPNIRYLVERVSTNESILTSIIASLERGNEGFAKDLESQYRKMFHIRGLGYADSHMLSFVEMAAEKKQFQLLLEEGKPLREVITKGNRKGNQEQYLGAFLLSFDETLFGIYAALSLKDRTFARQLIQEAFVQYFDKSSGFVIETMLRNHQCSQYNFSRSAAFFRAMDLAEDERGRQLWGLHRENIMKSCRLMLEDKVELFGRFYDGSINHYDHFTYAQDRDLVPLAFALDHFGDDQSLEFVKEAIVRELPKVQAEMEKEVFRHPNIVGSYQHKKRCRLGLALIGLEKDKPSQFYNP